jgi:hypothetical protein
MAVLETARVIEFASVVMLCAARAKGSLEGGSERLKGVKSGSEAFHSSWLLNDIDMHIYRRAKIGVERYGSKSNGGRNQDKGRQEGERCRAADNRPKGDWSVAITAGTSRGTGRALFFSICPLPRLWVRECYPTRGCVHIRFVPLLRICPSVLMQSRRPNPSFLLRSLRASITMHPRDDVPRPMAGARFF